MSISDGKNAVLVLLGDTTSMAHHAGALAALDKAGIDIEWVCGSSAGAISAAIIAGNAPPMRVRRLLEFREACEQQPTGLPRYFRLNALWGPSRSTSLDIATARPHLERLVDFTLLNSRQVRVTTLATNVGRGKRRFFDNARGMIGPDHILASSLAGPNTAAIEIDGERYWNDDSLSITPLQLFLDENEDGRHLVFVVDPWGRDRSFSRQPDWQPARAREIANITRIAYDLQGIGNNISLGRIVGEKRPQPLSAASIVFEPARLDIVHALSDSRPRPGDDHPAQSLGPDAAFNAAFLTISDAIAAKPWARELGDTPFAVHTVSAGEVSTEVYPGRTEGLGRIVPTWPTGLGDVFRTRGPVLETFNLAPKAPIIVSEFEPAPSLMQKPGLIFKLEGEHARGDEVVWGAAFDLVVDYGTAIAGALAAVTSELLVSAVSGPSAELGMMLTPRGFTLTDSKPVQRLIFENGRLAGEIPRFKLQAPQPVDVAAISDGSCGVWVVVTKARAPLHAFFLEIYPVETLQSQARPTRLIDFDLDDAASSEPEERTASISITSEGDSWRVYWDIDGVQSAPRLVSSVTPAKLKAAYDSFIVGDLTQVANTALWRNTDEQLQLPSDEPSRDGAQQAMFATAGAGYKLYKLFSEDPVFRDAIDLIDRLPDGSKITVITDDVVFPWELFYPLSFTDGYPAENYKPERFWGHRFIIESLLITTTSAEKLPPSRQQPGKLHVSMGLNESIDDDWKGRKLLPVQLQKGYFDKSFAARGDYAAGYKQVLSAMRKQPAVASLIYFFCHGSAEKLEFEKSTAFTPYNVAGPEFPQWPIVFVNACDAGNISPLSFFSFRKEFRKRRSAGLIAPSFPIPTLFAAVFATTFIERYARQETVGSILLDLRRKLLGQNNPLGLWYSLQCPLDLKAPRM